MYRRNQLWKMYEDQKVVAGGCYLSWTLKDKKKIPPGKGMNKGSETGKTPVVLKNFEVSEAIAKTAKGRVPWEWREFSSWT